MSKPAIKIGVLADTHIRRISDMPAALIRDLAKLDLIIHLGDFHTRELVEDMKALGNFLGVTGNHDNAQIKSLLPEKDILEVNGKRLGLVHGHGRSFPLGLKNGLAGVFEKDRIDAILYGHTHLANNKVIDNTLFFNPGSAIGRFPAARNSYGVLSIGDEIAGTIHYFAPQDNYCTLSKGTKSSHKLGHLARLHHQNWCHTLKRALAPIYFSITGQ